MLEESIDSIRNVSVMSVVSKLIELGVENIIVDQNKIEFEWCDRICSYKNGTFYLGTQSVISSVNIEKLDVNFLNLIVGKLTSEQLNRVGDLIDLFEERFEQLLSLQEDMASISMMETKLYQKNEQDLAEYRFTLVKLQKLFQTGILEDRIKIDILRYILKGE